MEIISAINIKNGRVFTGRDKAEQEWQDPIALACHLEEKGVDKLHVVDIDAAVKIVEDNKAIIKEIARSVHIPVQAAGGIRQLIQISNLLEAGIDQVVLGTIAVQYPNLLYQIIRNFGTERIAVSMDILGNKIRYSGWKKGVSMPIKIFIRLVESQGVTRIIYTDIERVHTLQGINFEKIREIAEYARANLTVAGGIRSIEDIQDLARLQRYRVDSIIIGKAIFSAEMDILEQIRFLKQNNEHSLPPSTA